MDGLRRLILAALCCALLAAHPARADTEQLTLADDPFETTDPHATDPGQAELAFVTIYERARQGPYRTRLSLDGEIQVGVAPGLDVRVGQRAAYGNIDSRGRSTAETRVDGTGLPGWAAAPRFGALYQITDGQGVLPLVSVLGRVRSTYTHDFPSYESDLVALFGKAIGSGPRAFGINLNLGWTARLNPIPGERPNLLFLNAAIGRAITSNAVVVLAYARGQQEHGERDLSIVEAGIRYRFGDGPVLGAAIGLGTTRDSPSLQVSFGVQWGFGVF